MPGIVKEPRVTARRRFTLDGVVQADARAFGHHLQCRAGRAVEYQRAHLHGQRLGVGKAFGP